MNHRSLRVWMLGLLSALVVSVRSGAEPPELPPTYCGEKCDALAPVQQASAVGDRCIGIVSLRNTAAVDTANNVLRSFKNLLVMPAEMDEENPRDVLIIPEPFTNSLFISATPCWYPAIVGLIATLDTKDPQILLQQIRSAENRRSSIDGQCRRISELIPSVSSRCQIKRSLKTPVTVSFKDVPLRQALDDLVQSFALNIVVDDAALESEGISLDRTVTLQLDEIALRTVLDLLVKKCDLGYIVKDDFIEITTKDIARGPFLHKIYFIGDLLRCQGQKCRTANELSKLITNMIEPNSWSDSGGSGDIDYFPLSQTLVIHQVLHLQEQVADLLEALRRLEKKTSCCCEQKMCVHDTCRYKDKHCSTPTNKNRVQFWGSMLDLDTLEESQPSNKMGETCSQGKCDLIQMPPLALPSINPGIVAELQNLLNDKVATAKPAALEVVEEESEEHETPKAIAKPFRVAAATTWMVISCDEILKSDWQISIHLYVPETGMVISCDEILKYLPGEMWTEYDSVANRIRALYQLHLGKAVFRVRYDGEWSVDLTVTPDSK